MACPNGEELLAFHLGELADAQIVAIGEHLKDCARCEQQTRHIDGLSDTALSALRHSDEMAPAKSPEQPGSVPQIPGYEILSLLGKGGMGEVYKARQCRLDRLVALKFLRTDSLGRLERFQTEAQAVARLSHPNIVQIFEVGEWQGQPFLTLEYLDGGTLGDHVKGKPQDAHASAALVQTLARAVHHAHAQGIVHRDLKPANILLKGVADSGFASSVELRISDFTPKVSDFGIAKHSQSSGQTREGDIIGTACYMAPEQAVGKAADAGPASDIYSLGVILYEMLTGRVPLYGATDLDTVLLVQQEEPVAPRRLQPGLPRDLETICLKCLHKEPRQRYASALELADDLGRMLAGEPVTARPTSPWERAWKWARRRPTAAALILVAALIVGVGFPGITYLWLQADYARQKADEAAAAEKAANQAAAQSAADAQAMLLFLEQKILIAARPEGAGGLGQRATLREALEAALPYVEENFAQQPLVEARLRWTLGWSFSTLHESQRSAEQFERARALYMAHLGPEHRDTLLSASSLASAYESLGRRPEAAKLLEETLALQKAKLGADDSHTIISMNALADLWFVLGRRLEAVELREQALGLRQAKHRPGHPDMLHDMKRLAWAYSELGRSAQALKLRQKVINLREQALAEMQRERGSHDRQTILTMENLARDYVSVSRHADALKLQEQIVALRQAKDGLNHADTMASMSDLASAYVGARRQLDAHKIFVDLLRLRRAKYGPVDESTLAGMHTLAESFTALKRHDEAFKLLEERLALLKVKLGRDDAQTLANMNSLALKYSNYARHAEAGKLHAELYELQKAKLGPDHHVTLTTMARLAAAYFKTGAREEAVKLHQERLRLQTAKFGPDHDSTLAMMRGVSNTFYREAFRPQAVKLQEQVLELLLAKSGPKHADTLKAKRDLAGGYSTMGRYADALKLSEEILAVRQATVGPDHPDTLSSMSSVVYDLVRLGRAEALPMIDDCLRRAAGKEVDATFIPRLMARRMEHFEKAKHAAGCRETAEMWEALKRTDADSLYDAARKRAVTAAIIRATDTSAAAEKDAAAEIERAMAWLDQAAATGFRNVARMKREPAFETLRARGDFKKLLAELEVRKGNEKK